MIEERIQFTEGITFPLRYEVGLGTRMEGYTQKMRMTYPAQLRT